MSALILDAGALIAAENDDRAFLARARVAEQHGRKLRTTSVVLAQVWRDATGRQAKLARFLKAVEILEVSEETGRHIGLLLAKSATRDVVDGSIAAIAHAGDQIATSDLDDIGRLIDAAGIRARIVIC